MKNSSNTVNSEINAFIYYCNFLRNDNNARLIIVISIKSAYRYIYHVRDLVQILIIKILIQFEQEKLSLCQLVEA